MVGPWLVSFALACAPRAGSYVGGSRDEVPFAAAAPLAIAVADNGEVYVAITTISDDLSPTPAAFAADAFEPSDVWIARLDANLASVVSATYLGGRGADRASSILIDAATGDVIVAGSTTSVDFPTTGGSASNGANSDGFVVRLDAALTTLRSGQRLRPANDVDSSDRVTQVSVLGDGLVVTLESNGGAFLQAEGAGAQDVFVVTLAADLTPVSAASFGSVADDAALSLAVSDDAVFIGGIADDCASLPHGAADVFVAAPLLEACGYVARFHRTGAVLDATPLGTAQLAGERFAARVQALRTNNDALWLAVNHDEAITGISNTGNASATLVRLDLDLTEVQHTLDIGEQSNVSTLIVDDDSLISAGTTRASSLPALIANTRTDDRPQLFVLRTQLDLTPTVSSMGGVGVDDEASGMANSSAGPVVVGLTATSSPLAGVPAQTAVAGGLDVVALAFDTALQPEGTCGDGVLNPGEACDDANETADDGCTACSVDASYRCEQEPSQCIVPTDGDLDGVSDTDERSAGTDGTDADSDDDGLLDGEDGLNDTDSDGRIDALDDDDDDDGIPTAVEITDGGEQVDADDDGLANWDDADANANGTADGKDGRDDDDGDAVRNYLDTRADRVAFVDKNGDGFADGATAGGGGCQQGNHWPLWWLVLAAALVAQRRRTALLTMLTLAVSLPALADDTTFSANRYAAAFDRRGIHDVEGARVNGHLRFDTALFTDVQRAPLTLTFNGTRTAVLGYRIDAHALLAMTLVDRLQLGLDVGAVPWQWRDGAALQKVMHVDGALPVVGIADPRLMLKFGLLRQHDGPLDLAVMVQGTLPVWSGSLQQPGGFIGDKGYTVAPQLLAGRTFGVLRTTAQFGVRFREVQTRFADVTIGNEWLYGAGAAVALDRFFRRGSEVSCSVSGQVGLVTTSLGTSPLEAACGARLQIVTDIAVNVVAGSALIAGVTAPQGRLLVGLRYAPHPDDADEDGFVDEEDACPSAAEDTDGHQDHDGCPDLDDDEDGVADRDDRCPLVAEDRDGNDDEDGCPEDEPAPEPAAVAPAPAPTPTPTPTPPTSPESAPEASTPEAPPLPARPQPDPF